MRAAFRVTGLVCRVAVCGPLLVPAIASAERLPIKAYTVEGGLAHNRVKRIVQDSHAFLWFCTAAGLSRFDGYQFTNYTPENGLPSLSVNDLVEGEDGVYWIATNSDGVIEFDLRRAVPSTRDLSSLFKAHSVSKEPVTNRVNVLYRDQEGTLWAGSDGGLFRMKDSGTARSFEAVELGIAGHPEIQVQVWTILQDRARNLWIGTRFGLVRRAPDGHMTPYAVRPSPEDDRVTALVVDADGSIWMGHRAGLFHFDPQSSPLEATGVLPLPAGTRRYTTADGLEDDAVMSLHQTSDRHLWVRSFGHGLTEFDGQRFRTYTVGDRVGDIIGSLTEDREGNLWLGTTAMGALKIMRDGWTTYGVGDGLGESVSSIFQTAAGDLYVNSTAWRISRFDGQRFTSVRPRLPPEVTDVSWRDVNNAIQDHTGDWWIATRSGVYRFTRPARFEDLGRVAPSAVYTTHHGLATEDVTRLFEDRHGDVWIGSWLQAREPLVRWERATGTFHRYSDAEGLPAFTSIVSLCEDTAGNLWVGLREGGLFRYRNGRFGGIGRNEGLPTSSSINSLYLDPAGRLWVAAGRGGLWRIEHPADDAPAVVAYTTRDGLTSTVIHVTGDGEGRIYASHMNGIDRLDPTTGQFNHYSTADVLPGSEFKSALRDQRGALWFCTTTGLARLVPAESRRTAPPPIMIGALRVAGVSRPLSALGEREVPPLRLGPGQSNIQIDFFGLGFRAGDTMRYEYKLEGATSDWSVPRVQRTVDFASLSPGQYKFLVRAVTTDGTVSTSPATVAFEILPPVWRRWWFLTAAACVVISGVLAFARYRYERVKALRDSENRFRTLAETASDAIVTIGANGTIVLVNHAAEKVFGYARREMIGCELAMLVPAHLRERHERAFGRYLATGDRTTSWDALAVTGVRKDGAEIPLEISFGEFTQHGQRFFTGIIRDVTERKRAEEALRRSREERLIELERVRKRIATDLHDDVGSSLTRISLLSEVVRRQVDGANPSVAAPLRSIASLSRELVDSMSDIVWAINPTKDHLSDLSQRMRHFVSDVCTARQIDFRFRTPPADVDIPVGANIRREVFLLFKEAVNNLVRHSGCSEADLEFRLTDTGLVLRIRDNGRGFALDVASDGHGLRSMRERTAGLGGQMEVESGPGAGAILTFTIPLTDRGHVDAAPQNAIPA